jgi:predicted flap endonuclease-1-like 5' DNA nuclease
MSTDLGWLWIVLGFLFIALLIGLLGRRKDTSPVSMARPAAGADMNLAAHPVEPSMSQAVAVTPQDEPEAQKDGAFPQAVEPPAPLEEQNTPVGVPAPAPLNAIPSQPESSPAVDELEIIEGIGPKIAALLRQAGLTTFAGLAAADTARLVKILTDARLNRLANPATWPKQAALAAEGRWDELKTYQNSLKGGREVS